MDLYVYSDESGVLAKGKDKYYIFGGLVILGKKQKDSEARKYLHVERVIRANGKYAGADELKACILEHKDKASIYRSLNNVYKFVVVIDKDRILSDIYKEKKSKQRYLDYAYKIGLKKLLEELLNRGTITPTNVKKIFVYCDEHTTATNGKYELEESLYQEYKIGTFNYTFSKMYPPILPGLEKIELHYFDSSKAPMVRAADIIANKFYGLANHELLASYVSKKENHKNLIITYLP